MIEIAELPERLERHSAGELSLQDGAIEALMSVPIVFGVDREGKPASVTWRANMWANINKSGHGNEFHSHPGSFWSGVYYVDDGGIGVDAARVLQ